MSTPKHTAREKLDYHFQAGIRPPEELETAWNLQLLGGIADVVLRYRPKPKSKASKRRAKRKRQTDAKKG